MALQHLLDAIRDDTTRRIDALEAVAAAERAEVLEDGARRAREAEEAAACALAGPTRRAVQGIVGTARADAAHRLRHAREDLLQQALDEVHTRLHGLRDDPERYVPLLHTLLAEARQALPTGSLAVLDPRDVDLLPDTPTTSAPAPLGGLCWRDDEGREVDDTLETRLATAMPALRQLAAVTFPPLHGSL